MKPEDKLFFHEFYEENKRFMYYIVRKFTAVEADCEDLLQDATLRLMHNIPTLRQLNRYKTAKYIFLTVKSAYLDSEKIRQKDTLLFLDDEELEKAMAKQMPTLGNDPAVAARIAVSRLKAELPPRDWIILEGKYLLGLSQEEISSMIGVAPNSVRMLLHRAREKAKEILNEEHCKGGDPVG